MCTSDRGVSSAELRPDVEGGRAAAADDDVVRVGVVFAPTVLVTGGTCSLYSRVWHETGSVRAIWICMYSHLTSGTRHVHLYKYISLHNVRWLGTWQVHKTSHIRAWATTGMTANTVNYKYDPFSCHKAEPRATIHDIQLKLRGRYLRLAPQASLLISAVITRYPDTRQRLMT